MTAQPRVALEHAARTPADLASQAQGRGASHRPRPPRRPARAPDPPFPQHKICTPLTLEMYYTELDPEHHRSLLAAIGAYPVGRKHGTETPWLSASYHAFKEGPRKASRAQARAAAAAAVTEPSRKPPGKPPGDASLQGEKEAAQKVAGSTPPPAPQ